MVRAGLGKRVSRGLLKSKNALASNLAGRVESSLAEKAQTQSTQATREVFRRKLEERPEACLCNEAYETFLQYRAACGPKRFDELKAEWATFKGKLFSPGTTSMGEARNFAVVLIQLVVIYWVGTMIGRGGLSWIEIGELEEQLDALQK